MHRADAIAPFDWKEGCAKIGRAGAGTDGRTLYIWPDYDAHLNLVIINFNNAINFISWKSKSPQFLTSAGKKVATAGWGKFMRSHKAASRCTELVLTDEDLIQGSRTSSF